MTPLHGYDEQNDADLLDELRDLASRVDPVPPELLAMAEASLVLHRIDADLAALTHDSAIDSGDLALVRGPAMLRLLTFEGPGITLELETVSAGRYRRLVGQVVPAQSGEVEIRHRGGVASTVADDLGRFVCANIEPGPVSVRCSVGGTEGRTVETDWFLT